MKPCVKERIFAEHNEGQFVRIKKGKAGSLIFSNKLWAARPDADVPVLCLTADDTWRYAPDCTGNNCNIITDNSNVKNCLKIFPDARTLIGLF